MQLALSTAGPAISPISPRRELGAYDALWLEKGATFKSLAERFSDDPTALPSDFAPIAIAERRADEALKKLKSAGVHQFGIRLHHAGDYPAIRGRGPRPDEELKQNRKRVLIGAAAILAVLGIAGRLSWTIPGIHINSHDQRRGPVTIGAEQLYQAYHEDSKAAARRFGGREIAVSGEFLRIVPDGYGSIDLRLKTSNPDSPLGVDLVGDAVEDAKRLRPGQKVTVSCQRMAGSGDDRWLQNCAIENMAEAQPPSPSPPTAPAAAEENSG
jgi:hypothetical protein